MRLILIRTAPVAYTFSANTILWDSMTKKLISCSTSSRRRSREALGIVKYVLGRNWEVRPRPRASFPRTSAEAVAVHLSVSHSRPFFYVQHTTEGQVDGLEDVTNHVQVPCGKDEDDGRSEGDGSSARVLPLHFVSIFPPSCLGISELTLRSL